MTPENSLLILFGSQTNTAKTCAQQLCHILNTLWVPARLSAMDAYPMENIMEESLVLAVVATTGRGEPPSNMRNFWDQIMDADLDDDVLDHLFFSVFGLGDSSYEQYNVVSRVLDKRFRKLGAHEFVARGLGDDQEVGGYLRQWRLWVQRVLAKCLEIPSNAPLSKRFPYIENSLAKWTRPPKLDKEEQSGIISGLQQMISKDSPDIAALEDLCKKYIPFQLKSTQKPSKFTWETQEYVPIKVSFNNLLTAKSHFQKVFHLGLELDYRKSAKTPSLNNLAQILANEFNPGDCLKIMYQNDPDEVKQLMSFFQKSQNDLFLLKPIDSHDHLVHPDLPREGGQTLESLLTHYFDIKKYLTFDAVKILGQFCELEEVYQERLQEMDYEEYIDYVVREKRTLCEILFDFRVRELSPEFLFQALPPVRAREYSVAGLVHRPESGKFGS